MNGKKILSKNMTIKDFDKGYWYVHEIRDFAKKIGIPNSSQLRKDELEELIKVYLTTGELKASSRKMLKKTGLKDIEKGLHLSLEIVNYTSNKETKKFILDEALKKVTELKIKSGVWYRLNRWRDEEMTLGSKITYGDLVNKFIELNQTKEKFEKIEVGRYINFLSDYLRHEKNATRDEAIIEWKKLKELDIKKDYQSWKKFHNEI
ncbi:MAG: SAP domain-containing protein [Spirochaetes bacterium]|nr:SAP domain-containing protein [Spirochaetota bacterium]